MTAALAPVWSEESLDFDYKSLAPNHPAVRSKQVVSYLRSATNSSDEMLTEKPLSWRSLIGRAVLFALVTVAALVLGALVGIGLDPFLGLAPVDYFSHTVVTGDTLWNLAAANAASLPTEEVLEQIMKINQLDAASVLQAGQQVLIPIY